MLLLNCLVDNKTLDSASFQAEHGVAFAIENAAGKILFDTGMSGSVLVHNAASMGIDLHQMDAIALSHAHLDHTGGLKAFMAYSQPGLPLFAHPEIFRQRFSIKDGKTRSIGLPLTRDELAQYFTLRLSMEAVEVIPRVWTTGEITSRKEFEGSSPHLYIQEEDTWQPDPYRDDMSLVLEGESSLVLVCGCCHAGLLNTLAQVQRMSKREIKAIVGGAHLAGVDANTLQHAVDVIRTTCAGHVPDLYLNHCTGDRATSTLAQAFGEKVCPCPAGTVLAFD